MIDDDYELASAYCDGELDPAQRDAVEHDPAVFALVAEITALRATLAGQLPETLNPPNRPSPEVRARHLELAAAAYAGAPPAAPVIDLRNRRRYRMLTLAAGFVVVAGVGVAALSGLSDSSNDSALTDASSDDASSTDAGELATDIAASDGSPNSIVDNTDALADSADAVAESAVTAAPANDAADDADAAAATESTERGQPALALTAGVEPSHYFAANATLDVIFDTVMRDSEPAVNAVCRPDLLPPGVETSSYVIDRNGERLQVLVGIHRIATNVVLVDGECQPLDELERPTD